MAVPELTTPEHEIAVIVDRLLRGAFAVAQCRERHVGLEGRARRVGSRQRPVDERAVERGIELTPALRVDAIDEQVGIEARLAHESQYRPGCGLERDQRAAPVAEGAIGHALEPSVEIEHHVVSGHRRRARKRAHRATAGIDLDFLDPGGAVKKALVAPLDSGLSDVVGAAVVRKQPLVLETVELALVDTADMAYHVREDLALRVLPERAGVDFHLGKPEAVGGEARDFLVREAGAYRNGAHDLALLEQPLEAAPVSRPDFNHRRDFIHQPVDVADVLRPDLERVRGIIVRQHGPVAIDDDAPVRRHRQDRDAICLRERAQLAVPHDLQVEKAQSEQREDEQHERRCDRNPGMEVPQLELGVPDLDPGVDRKLRHDRGRTWAAAGS